MNFLKKLSDLYSIECANWLISRILLLKGLSASKHALIHQESPYVFVIAIVSVIMCGVGWNPGDFSLGFTQQPSVRWFKRLSNCFFLAFCTSHDAGDMTYWKHIDRIHLLKICNRNSHMLHISLPLTITFWWIWKNHAKLQISRAESVDNFSMSVYWNGSVDSTLFYSFFSPPPTLNIDQ